MFSSIIFISCIVHTGSCCGAIKRNFMNPLSCCLVGLFGPFPCGEKYVCVGLLIVAWGKIRLNVQSIRYNILTVFFASRHGQVTSVGSWDFREAFREAVQVDALARHGVSDERTRMVSTAILFCIYVLDSLTRHPACLRRGLPAYPGPLLCTTTLRLVSG